MKRYFEQVQEEWRDGPLADWLPLLPEIIKAGLNPKRYGDLPQWQGALEALPSVESTEVELRKEVAIDGDSTAQQRADINAQLQALIPWRKGPFTVHGTHIDTEWRSDWKWDRLLPHIADLNQRLVLDVGCGNGYHCWRMLGEGAARVVGIDPSPRFVVQFLMIKHFLANAPVDVLPCTLDELPPLSVFDSVFSMGVLYHRPSPIDHLRQLKSLLRPGGELVLETLVIDGDDQSVLVPSGRYAMMNNVWFIPSPASLLIWLAKVGFRNPRVVDISRTTCEEQRATEWMRFHSLANFLDAADPDKTVEGYPAPLRAIFVADCD